MPSRGKGGPDSTVCCCRRWRGQGAGPLFPCFTLLVRCLSRRNVELLDLSAACPTQAVTDWSKDPDPELLADALEKAATVCPQALHGARAGLPNMLRRVAP
jgi:hypothetical protein